MSHGKDDREARILRERRASLGLTQDQVATEAGIEMRAYQRYEHSHPGGKDEVELHDRPQGFVERNLHGR